MDRIVYLGIELGYHVSRNLRFTAGGANNVDRYVDDIGASINSNRYSWVVYTNLQSSESLLG